MSRARAHDISPRVNFSIRATYARVSRLFSRARARARAGSLTSLPIFAVVIATRVHSPPLPSVCQKCSARQLGTRSSKLAPAAIVRPHRECPLCSAAAAQRALWTKRGLRRPRSNSLSSKAGALNLARIAFAADTPARVPSMRPASSRFSRSSPVRSADVSRLHRDAAGGSENSSGLRSISSVRAIRHARIVHFTYSRVQQ